MRNLFLAVVILACFSIVNSDAATDYKIIDLGVLSGDYTGSVAYAINDSGQIAGVSSTENVRAPKLRATKWNADGSISELGPDLDQVNSFALSINSSGQVVGYIGGHGSPQACLWSPDNEVIVLNSYSGVYAINSAYAINDAGQIVGDFMVGGYGFVWDKTTGMVDIGSLGLGAAHPRDINTAGWIVGNSVNLSGYEHAFLRSPDGNMQDLGSLSGGMSLASAVNDALQVVGSSYLPNGEPSAFIWSANTGMVDLGMLSSTGFGWSEAYDINNAGYVVGASNGRAFLFKPETGMVDLGMLPGGERACAYGINTAGWIVGSSSDATGNYHAVLWQPVPEPSSLATLCLGLLPLMLMRKRR